MTYLSWFAFLYPFMFEIPARSNEFEQLCECLRRCASAELAGPELLLVFLNAEKSFCHLDIEAAAVVVVEAEAADGPRGPGWNLKRPEEKRNSWRCCCCCWCRCCCCCYCWWSNRYCKTLFVVTGGSVIWDNIRKSVFATIIKQKSFLFVKKSLLMSYLWCVKRSLNNCR